MKRRKKTINYLGVLLFLSFFVGQLLAQNDVMMQAFYWEPPVDETNENGSWWDSLAAKSGTLSDAGFTGIWVPPPSKGNWGITDMGYGIYDHYDLGNYNQKGSIETRFGSRSELEAMIDSMHNNNIEVYADVILNHIYANEEDDLEYNPAVECYVESEAYTNGSQHVPYPTNEIVWKMDNAPTGYYYIRVKGYELDWSASYKERGYDLFIDWNGSGSQDSTWWESEPNDGSGNWNSFSYSGGTVRGHMSSSSDRDEYRIYLSSASDVEIRLTAKKEATPFEWLWADQTNGYRIDQIYYGGNNVIDSLHAHTATGIDYVTHTGTGEANHNWNYSHFHPVDCNDWLGDGGTNDAIVTNTKWFGNDLNTFSSTVDTRLKDWGEWLCDEIEFDGFRLDFVRGFQPYFAAGWINNLPNLGGSQRYVVAEYWGNAQVIHDWVDSIDAHSADADAFDFPLKFTLTDMCNKSYSNFEMDWLNHAGMVRNNSGLAMSGTQIVTFVDNHDSGKEHDKWISQDWEMAYAYIITHEGRPCVFYPHYYGVEQVDNHDSSNTTQAPSSLQDDIDDLISIRKTYLGGSLTVLSEDGNPYPSSDVDYLYVARRAGNGSKSGAIIAINNHTSTKSLWVDSSPSGWADWGNTTLVNALDSTETTYVYNDTGRRVNISAPPRSFKVWVKQSEYTSLAKRSVQEIKEMLTNIPIEFEIERNYPNPFNPTTNIVFSIPREGIVNINIYNALGERVDAVYSKVTSSGKHEVTWNASNHPSGVYISEVSWNGRSINSKMLLLK